MCKGKSTLSPFLPQNVHFLCSITKAARQFKGLLQKCRCAAEITLSPDNNAHVKQGSSLALQVTLLPRFGQQAGCKGTRSNFGRNGRGRLTRNREGDSGHKKQVFGQEANVVTIRPLLANSRFIKRNGVVRGPGQHQVSAPLTGLFHGFACRKKPYCAVGILCGTLAIPLPTTAVSAFEWTPHSPQW